jgi:hypothetical protein
MVSQELSGDLQQAEPASIVYQYIYIHIYQIINVVHFVDMFDPILARNENVNACPMP